MGPRPRPQWRPRGRGSPPAPGDATEGAGFTRFPDGAERGQRVKSNGTSRGRFRVGICFFGFGVVFGFPKGKEDALEARTDERTRRRAAGNREAAACQPACRSRNPQARPPVFIAGPEHRTAVHVSRADLPGKTSTCVLFVLKRFTLRPANRLRTDRSQPRLRSTLTDVWTARGPTDEDPGRHHGSSKTTTRRPRTTA